MKRIFLFTLFLLVGYLFIYPQHYGIVGAQSINITPSSFTSRDPVGLRIEISGLIQQKYMVFAERSGGKSVRLDKLFQITWTPDAEGKIVIEKVCGYLGVRDNCGTRTFMEGAYTVVVKDPLDKTIVSGNFTVSPSIKDVTIIFQNEKTTPPTFTTMHDIILEISGLTYGSYKIEVDGKDTENGISCFDSKGGFKILNIGNYYEGTHQVRIYDNDKWPHPLCGKGSLATPRSFTIDNTTGGGGKPQPSPGSSPGPTGEPGHGPELVDCDGGKGKGIQTALGCIPTQNLNTFAGWFLGWAIGIGGGIAFLLILFSGFQIMTSAGNPERLKAGKEQLTAAIAGLLFLVFSVFLLKLIGVDILQLPGFGR